MLMAAASDLEEMSVVCTMSSAMDVLVLVLKLW